MRISGAAWAVLVLFAIFCAIATYLHLTREPSRRDVLACFAAQATVKQRLAVSARFPSCLDAKGVTAEGEGLYVVRSHFESPDASGVYREHSYRVIVDDKGHEFRAYVATIQ
jgi:hypothetical protein